LRAASPPNILLVPLLISLVVCAAAYFVGGFLFCRFARHKEGKEAIPNYEFWTDLPALIKVLAFLLRNISQDNTNISLFASFRTAFVLSSALAPADHLTKLSRDKVCLLSC
jgi:hypothetical protein